MSEYKKNDPNECCGTRASRNHCNCGKLDPNLPGWGYERVIKYICEECQEFDYVMNHKDGVSLDVVVVCDHLKEDN